MENKNAPMRSSQVNHTVSASQTGRHVSVHGQAPIPVPNTQRMVGQPCSPMPSHAHGGAVSHPYPGAVQGAPYHAPGVTSHNQYVSTNVPPNRPMPGRGSVQPPSKPPKKIFWIVLLVVSLVVLLVSAGVIGVILHGYHKGAQTYDTIAAEAFVKDDTDALSSMYVDWDGLLAQNPDTVAWIYVPGTNINYPVVQGKNDAEYLHQNFLREDTPFVHTGTIFVSEANAHDLHDEALFLYGHNMNDGTMFGPIMDLFDQTAFDAHREVYVLTPEKNYRCETFALRLIPSTETSIIQPHLRSQSMMNDYMEDQIQAADVTPTQALDTSTVEKIFSLITCGDDYANTRAVLFAGAVETAVPEKDGVNIADVGVQSAVDDKVAEGKTE